MQYSKSKQLIDLAQKIAKDLPDFFETKGPGAGNRSTNEFMSRLRLDATSELHGDYSEKKLCGDNSLAVDFYFPSEATICEIALGISKPNSEYEKTF